jgi:tetratricopeptide (TPR) repeat protein
VNAATQKLFRICRLFRRVVLVLAVGLTIVPIAHAGIYLPADPEGALLPIEGDPPKPLPFDEFHNVLLPRIIGVGLPPRPGLPESQLRQQYQHARDQLRRKGLTALSAEEAVSLSGYQIRLREYTPAEETLRAALRRFDDRPELYANLAALKFLEGGRDENVLNEAVVNQSIALRRLRRDKSRPAGLIRTEEALLKLIQERQKELRQPGPGGRANDRLDDLFPPGVFADSHQREERAAAIAVVQQLLYWFPDDARLYWQLAELHRADGDLAAANRIYDQCVDVRAYRPPDLWKHRTEVKEELAKQAAAAPRTAPTGPTERPPWWPSPERLGLVGGAAGLVLALLIYLQWRQFRRRRPAGRR